LVIGSPFEEISGDGRARYAVDGKSHYRWRLINVGRVMDAVTEMIKNIALVRTSIAKAHE
jgi:hypothetical protein